MNVQHHRKGCASMKKLLKIFIVCVLAVSALTVCSLAADYTAAADNLNEMGLFLGTGSGYALDSPATRGQAAKMLVRLLGYADKVGRGDYSHPFTDVPEWVGAEVGYMYETGLTKGVGGGRFDTDGLCSRQMYATFILRALGYTEEAGDFTYANAEAFARSIGVEPLNEGQFLRGDMAAVSYSALFLPVKGSDVKLLQKLAEDGAVSAYTADKFLTMYETYCSLRSVRLDSEGGLHVKSTQTSSSRSSGINVSRTVSSDVLVEETSAGPRVQLTTEMTYLGARSVRTVWYDAGVLYYRGDEGSFRIDQDDVSPLLESVTAASGDDYTGFFNVKSLTAEADASGTVYRLVYSALNMDRSSARLILGDDSVTAKSGDITVTVTAGSDGTLRTWRTAASVTAVTGGKSVEQDVDLTLTVVETGSAVKVTMPDPAEFRELPGSYAGLLKGLR